MIELEEFLLRFSIFSVALYFLRHLRKNICMALITNAASTPSSSGPSPTSWLGSFLAEKASSSKKFGIPKRQKVCFIKNHQPIIDQDQSNVVPTTPENNKKPIEVAFVHPGVDVNIVPVDEKNVLMVTTEGLSRPVVEKAKIPCGIKQSIMLRKRPAQLILPAFCPVLDFGEAGKKSERKEFQAEGKGFALASKKGRRETMEDGHGVMLDISGNPKQAFFVVIDGHGGRAAADFVAENLGRNIMNEIKLVANAEKHQIEAAVRRGYSVTDDQFLNQKEHGGACAASVLVKDGELHVANVGDCKVVLSRSGVATALTNDHRLTREEERARIENSGGFLDCRNGVWRVNGTLAVSRAFGDLHLKDHVISEPDILQLPLTSNCDFLIMASDGLWDKVANQEAVDVVVSRRKDALECCKELVAMASSRGGIDDVTVMVINLHNFAN